AIRPLGRSFRDAGAVYDAVLSKEGRGDVERADVGPDTARAPLLEPPHPRHERQPVSPAVVQSEAEGCDGAGDAVKHARDVGAVEDGERDASIDQALFEAVVGRVRGEVDVKAEEAIILFGPAKGCDAEAVDEPTFQRELEVACVCRHARAPRP